MSTSKPIIAICVMFSFLSCSRSERGEMKEQSVTDTNSNAFISSSAAVENKSDTTHKFIRTADLKFKVKNVIRSTYDIEEITTRQGGFVTYTNLASNINNVSTIAVSADSSLETTSYTVTNSITLRVPNTRLDTILKEISRNIDFLNYRVIKADDVALKILSNTLAQKRSKKAEERLATAIDERGKKLNETTIAEEKLTNRQDQADNATIANLSLKDQINFSTINLAIYERPAIKRELISNDKNIDAYEPGFLIKIKESLKFGWDLLEGLIVFLTKFWALFLIAFVFYIVFKRYGHKIK